MNGIVPPARKKGEEEVISDSPRRMEPQGCERHGWVKPRGRKKRERVSQSAPHAARSGSGPRSNARDRRRQSITCRLGPLSFRCRFIARLHRVVLGHVLALPRSAIKPRACPVINTGLRVGPHLTMAPAWRGWVSRFIGRASCGRRARDRTRCFLRLRLLWRGFRLRRRRWGFARGRRCSFLSW
jgi:hypothetical protein